MSSARISRIILIVLLPAIAVVLYLEGQHYDPALIRFQPPEAGAEKAAAFFPAEIDGYTRTGPLRTFTRGNLYEYINGHAEYFISSGFIELTTGEYAGAAAAAGQSDVVVDIYDMGKGIQAFGILADEAGENPEYVQVGSMGFQTARSLGFIKAKYYVKVTAFVDQVPLERIAAAVEGKIGATAEPFAVFSRFPDLGEVVATRYIKEAYRGLEFVNNVLERQYSVNGKPVQVFLVTGDAEKIGALVSSFLDYFRRSGIAFEQISAKNGRIIYKVQDPYEGDWFLLPAPDALFGVFGAVDESMLDAFAKKPDG